MRVLGIVTLAIGCGGSIRARDYDQTCEIDADCVVINDGEKCAIERCSCGNASINAQDLERFDADLAALVCIPVPRLDNAECLCAPAAEPICSAGSCALSAVINAAE
jgi:hypothetical protein